MPGGRGKITGAEGNTFSSTNQPKNRRKSTKFLTDLLKKELQSKQEVILSGIDVETGKPVKVKVPLTNTQTIVKALLRKAAKGDTVAIREVFDRVEGKVSQPLDLGTQPEGFDVTLKV